jgi:YegS/Rv2252/BmrU family lipid kinase
MVRRRDGTLWLPATEEAGIEEPRVDRPLCLIVNPAAGNGRARGILPAVTSALAAAGTKHRVVTSSSLAQARELAADAAQRGEVIVAVGGDGTAGGLAAIAAGRGAVFGLIPAGRGNDLARVLHISPEPVQAVSVLAAGHQRAIDLIAASVPGHEEIVVAGSVYAGIPAVAGQIANASRWIGGPLLYPVAALRALAGWRPATFTIQAAPGDRTGPARIEFEGYAVVVANSAYFGAGMQVAPPAVVDDGVLDLVLMRHAPKVAFVRALVKIKDGSHVTLPQISLVRGADVTITMNRDLPAGADGELLPCAAPLPARTPLRIRVLPAALTVLAPAG